MPGGLYFLFSDLNTLVFFPGSFIRPGVNVSLLTCLPLLLESPGLYIFFVRACLIYEVFHLTTVHDI